MNFLRYYWTIKNLKPIQIYYQLKYRVLGFRSTSGEKSCAVNNDFDISIDELDCDEDYCNRFKPEDLLNNRLELLHEAEILKPGKWHYEGRVHLWNFNLHYFEFCISLAAKYRSTKNKKYYDKIKYYYNDWRDACFSRQAGDAWHPYTISLRLKNLLIVAGILGDQGQEFLNLIKQDMYIQYCFLLRNQERNLLGNHYFENLVTLYLCSLFFDNQKNQESVRRSLSKEIDEQILSDGMHFERSFMYHNLILEDMIRVYKIGDDGIKSEVQSVIESMADCVYSFEDDGRLPAFNDAGSNVSKDKKQLLAAIKSITGYAPQYKDRLDEAGYYIIQNNKYKLIIDAGDIAPKYISGHGHCDALSFELYYDGMPIIVNSGTYQYQTEYRNYFRSTAAHNTLCIDGIEQSEIWGEHRTGRQSKVIRSNIGKTKISASIKDYKGNILTRCIEVDNEVRFIDSASTGYSSYWHFHPNMKVESLSDNNISVCINDNEHMHIIAEDGIFEELKNNNLYSEEFGVLQNNVVLKSKAQKLRIFVD